MKEILYIIPFFAVGLATAQENTESTSVIGNVSTETITQVVPEKESRWFYQGELSFTFPRNGGAKYSYSWLNSRTNLYEGNEALLNEKPIISSDFTVNYRLFRILSVGAVGGFTHFQNPVASGLKLGSVIRLNPVKNYQGNIFVQVAGFLPLSTLVKPSIGEVKVGLSIPFLVRNKYSMFLSAYTSYTSFDVAEPLFWSETPEMMEYRGIGFSFGVRF